MTKYVGRASENGVGVNEPATYPIKEGVTLNVGCSCSIDENKELIAIDATHGHFGFVTEMCPVSCEATVVSMNARGLFVRTDDTGGLGPDDATYIARVAQGTNPAGHLTKTAGAGNILLNGHVRSISDGFLFNPVTQEETSVPTAEVMIMGVS